jgi:hypothetical protein
MSAFNTNSCWMRLTGALVLAGATQLAIAQDETPQATVSPDADASKAGNTFESTRLDPLPASGSVPPIVQWDANYMADLAHRADVRGYEKQMQILRRRFFGSKRAERIRAEGIAELQEFSDPAAFWVMIEVLAREADDVRLAMLDHFAEHGDDGQAALAWVAIHDHDDAIRHEASKRLVVPATDSVLHQLDGALRSPDHTEASHAATLAGTLGAAETIPLLIFAQAAGGPAANPPGDLAWIAIQTQRAYVQGIQAVAGDASAAFQPIIGVLNEGVLLRVVDAVAIIYRTEVHTSLVALSTHEWDQSTAHLYYYSEAWWHWYNDEYVPYKNDLVLLDELAGEVNPGS